MPLGDVGPGLIRRHGIQPLLLGCAEVDGHFLHRCKDYQEVGVQLLGQTAGGEVLVNDGLHPLQVALLCPNHRDPTAAAGDHNLPRLHQVTDGGQLHNGGGLGGGHHPAQAPAGVLCIGKAPLRDEAVGLLPTHVGADGLGGVLESRVSLIHNHMGEHGADLLGDPPPGQLVPDGDLQIVADVALAHGAADGQGAEGILVRLLLVQGGHGLLDHAHLGAVAVGDDHLVALRRQIHDGLGGVAHRLPLLLIVIPQGVAAQGDDNSFSHFGSSCQKIG